MSDFIQQFGFGQGDRGIGQQSKRFKGEGGKRYRISFAWWEGIEDGTPNFEGETPQFVGGRRLYIPNVGYVFDKGPEYAKYAPDGARTSIATIIVVWPTMSNGKLDEDLFKRGDFDVMPWVFGQNKYRDLEPNHANFHFGTNDLVINCTDSQYQKMSFVSAQKNLFAGLLASKSKKMQERGAEIIQAVSALVPAIRDEIARDLTLDQIREKLGGISASPTGDNGAADVGDVDDILDDLLDD
jgi:hypothetical protein